MAHTPQERLHERMLFFYKLWHEKALALLEERQRLHVAVDNPFRPVTICSQVSAVLVGQDIHG
jgi:hypothetical protein